MATSLAAIRAKLAQSENRPSNQPRGESPIYPHWNIEEGTTARLRFLPDADQNNSFFWIERLVIKLPFPGIKGDPSSKPTIVQVPCVEMWGEQCPILAEVRTWYKDESMKEFANKYWKKKSYLFQGFVRDNPLGDDKSPENPIRRFIISPQIFTLIKESLMDPELEDMPTDYERGLDFTVKKGSKGGYSDYSTSSWSRKTTALSADELEAIEKYGLFNLADFLPKKPTEVELDIMKQMFESSVDGEAFDMQRFGQYFKPSGYRDDVDSSPTQGEARAAAQATPVAAAPVAAPVAKPEPVAAAAPWEAEEAVAAPAVAPSANKQSAQDILAMIRNRK